MFAADASPRAGFAPRHRTKKRSFLMDNLSNIGVIREVMTRHGFTFSKALGQNFLINPSVCPRMAEQGGAGAGVGVLEIGAGVGVLTVELSRRAERVVCVEIDERLLPVLDETLKGCDNVEIVNADVMQVDLHALIAEKFSGCTEVVVCANLPYYITSPVIMRLLEQQLPVRAVTVMVQKEAAKRLCAEPGTRDVGAVSLAVRYYSEPKILFSVSRGSFMPAPDVDSAVIRLDVRQTPPVDAPPSVFFKVVRAAFSQRRKTMLNCLASGLALSKEQAAQLLEAAEVPPGARAEQLSIEQFAAIARAAAV